MRTILQLGLGLAFLTSPALGQSPNPLANSRIVDVSPAATGIRAYQPPAVERFDRQRALQERADSQAAGHQFYPVQVASKLQPITPPVASSPPTRALVMPPASLAAITKPAPAAAACSECAPKAPAPRQWRRLLVQEQCASARDMVPHYAYQAPYGTSYYFLPYMPQKIGEQAEQAGAWSGDRFNPYDNRFLQAIYGPVGE